MNREKFLPIGTVVLLKDAKKRLMIIGYIAKTKSDLSKTFDYVGCLYPEGVISSEKNFLFNHEQIKEIYYIGYSDDEWKEKSAILNDIGKKIESGKFKFPEKDE